MRMRFDPHVVATRLRPKLKSLKLSYSNTGWYSHERMRRMREDELEVIIRACSAWRWTRWATPIRPG
jgi:hypothetical protein